MAMMLNAPGKRPPIYSVLVFAFFSGGVRTMRIGLRDQAFAVGHKDPVGRGRHPHARRVPADGNEAQRAALPAVRDVDHGQVVGVGVGHPQCFAVGRQGQAVGRAAVRGLGVKRRGDDLDLPARPGVDHADRVAVGAGHVEQVLVRRKDHFRRVRGRGPGGLDLFPTRAIDHRHRRFPPEADVQPIGLRRGKHGIGVASGRHGDRLLLLRMLQRQGHQPIAQAAGRIEPFAVVAARQAGGHLGRLLLGKLDDLAVREISVGKVELVNHVVFTAADQQSLSVGGEAEAVERLGQGDAATRRWPS